MADPSERLLRLLSLLQRRQRWSGPELADRLAVTTRTVRRDVDRLRSLGYPVDAEPGVEGGYRLAAGADLPPLLLDDDEATAVALALATSTGGAVAGIGEPALAALAKLDRVLPDRLLRRVATLRASTSVLAGPTADDVDPDVLVVLAQACDGHERVALAYQDREGQRTDRRVEPHRLVATGRRWYLVAADVDRGAWRSFRVDRIGSATATGHRFTPAVDAPDPVAFVGEAITASPYGHRAVVRFDVPAEVLAAQVPPTVGTVTPDGDGCTLVVGADRLADLAGHLIALDLPFEVVEPAELRTHLRDVADRLATAHPPTGPPPAGG